jgi:hypothetical protein
MKFTVTPGLIKIESQPTREDDFLVNQMIADTFVRIIPCILLYKFDPATTATKEYDFYDPKTGIVFQIIQTPLSSLD